MSNVTLLQMFTVDYIGPDIAITAILINSNLCRTWSTTTMAMEHLRMFQKRLVSALRSVKDWELPSMISTATIGPISLLPTTRTRNSSSATIGMERLPTLLLLQEPHTTRMVTSSRAWAPILPTTTTTGGPIFS